MAAHLIALTEVLHQTSLGKTTIYALIKQNAFPKPVKVGKASSDQISGWISRQTDQPDP